MRKKFGKTVNFLSEKNENYVNFLSFFSKKVFKFKKTLHTCHFYCVPKIYEFMKKCLKLTASSPVGLK